MPDNVIPFASPPALALPTTRSAPSKRWIDQRIMVIGQGGLGKSSLLSHGEKTLFIDTEGGIEHLSVMKLRCETFEDFRAQYLLLLAAATAGTFPYDTIVVDTLDKYISAAENDTVKWGRSKFTKSDIKTIGDVPEGQGWNRTKSAIMGGLENLAKLPAALVLITHPKTIKIEEPTAKYDKETICAWGQLAPTVLGWMHHNLHIEARYGQGGALRRTVRTVPSKNMEAKSHGGIIPDGLEWKTADLAAEYAHLRSLFD